MSLPNIFEHPDESLFRLGGELREPSDELVESGENASVEEW